MLTMIVVRTRLLEAVAQRDAKKKAEEAKRKVEEAERKRFRKEELCEAGKRYSAIALLESTPPWGINSPSDQSVSNPEPVDLVQLAIDTHFHGTANPQTEPPQMEPPQMEPPQMNPPLPVVDDSPIASLSEEDHVPSFILSLSHPISCESRCGGLKCRE